MEIKPARLEWRRVDSEADDYDLGMDYYYVADVPGFGLRYEISFDDSDAERDMHLAADESGVVHMEVWNRIRKNHGDPSESSAKWAVALCTDKGDVVFEVASGLNAFNAQVAAQIDFSYRVNTAAGVYAKEPDFEFMFNPLAEIECAA